MIFGPMPDILLAVERKHVLKMIGGLNPDASLMVARVPEGKTWSFHIALKLYKPPMKRRDISTKFYGFFPPSVRVKIRGVAGWDRLCRRILSEDPECAYRILMEDLAAFHKMREIFQ